MYFTGEAVVLRVEIEKKMSFFKKRDWIVYHNLK